MKIKSTSAIVIIVIVSGILISPFLAEYVLSDKFFSDPRGFLRGERVSTIDDESNLAGRVAGIWVPVINYTKSNSLLLGFGPKSYNEIASRTTFTINNDVNSREYIVRAPHNLFIFIFVEYGLIGVILLLSIIASAIFMTYKKYLSVKDTNFFLRKIAAAGILSWIGFLSWCLVANAWLVLSLPFLSMLLVLSHADLERNESIKKQKIGRAHV